jgi:quinol monooxygenase YgiN
MTLFHNSVSQLCFITLFHNSVSFDAFADESGRQAHLSGPIAQALMAKAQDLLASRPVIEHVDVLGAKLPG